MATREDQRRKGFGRLLVRFLQDVAASELHVPKPCGPFDEEQGVLKIKLWVSACAILGALMVTGFACPWYNEP